MKQCLLQFTDGDDNKPLMSPSAIKKLLKQIADDPTVLTFNQHPKKNVWEKKWSPGKSKKKKAEVLPNPRSSFGKMVKAKLDKLNNQY